MSAIGGKSNIGRPLFSDFIPCVRTLIIAAARSRHLLDVGKGFGYVARRHENVRIYKGRRRRENPHAAFPILNKRNVQENLR
jgi:hypothetical protein